MVKRLLKNDAEVQDALQEIMLKLWKKRQQLLQHEKPDAYVLTVCRNHCLDVLKKKRACAHRGRGQLQVDQPAAARI